MAKMINSKYGWTWSQFVKADADCDRYWQAKKAEKRSLIEATKKIAKSCSSRREEDKRKNLYRLLACL